MTSQSKFFLILAVLVIILLIGGGVIGFLYWQSMEQETTVEAIVEEVEEKTEEEVTTNINVAEEVVEEAESKEMDEEDFVQQLAKSFTERYGSFSNQNDYENLLDLKIYMTNKMQKEVDEFIEANKAEEGEEQAYYGITTKVLTLNKLSLEDDKGEYNVSCQRKEAKGLEGGSRTYTESAKIEFKKVDGQWKVHSFTWL